MRYYWLCFKCKIRGNSLYDSKREVLNRIEIHNTKYGCNSATVHQTKHWGLPLVCWRG